MTPRGYRNNNPGNIRYIARNPWLGQIGNDDGYGVYDSPRNGTRACGRELAKRARAGFDTVRDVIAGKLDDEGNRQGGWAPAAENNTAAYIADVAGQLSIDPDETFDVLASLPELARAIAKHENGYIDSTYAWEWARL